ncbi:MAG: hypothetical protein AAF688_11845 [Bacteroidota bacterium]
MQKETIISYTDKVPIWRTILGLAALAVSFYGIFMLDYFSFVLLVLSIMLLRSRGTEIDLSSITYRKTFTVLGLKFGKWQQMDAPEYISVFNTSEDVTVRIITAETTNSKAIIKLNLFFENNKQITVYRTTDFKDAFDVASHIASALIIDLLDATVKNDFRWVDTATYRESGKIVHIE